MSIISDSSDDQRTALMQILGYSIQGLKEELPWDWRVVLYCDLLTFLEASFIEDDIPDEYIGKIMELKGYMMAEHETLKGGGIN